MYRLRIVLGCLLVLMLVYSVWCILLDMSSYDYGGVDFRGDLRIGEIKIIYNSVRLFGELCLGLTGIYVLNKKYGDGVFAGVVYVVFTCIIMSIMYMIAAG